jgi:hypothetical protein
MLRMVEFQQVITPFRPDDLDTHARIVELEQGWRRRCPSHVEEDPLPSPWSDSNIFPHPLKAQMGGIHFFLPRTLGDLLLLLSW